MAFLRTTLFSICLSGAALPVFAQSTQPATPPATPSDPTREQSPAPATATTPVPDTGIKHTAPATQIHRKTHHHVHAAKTPAPATQSGT